MNSSLCLRTLSKSAPKPMKLLTTIIKDTSAAGSPGNAEKQFLTMIKKLQREKERAMEDSLISAATSKVIVTKTKKPKEPKEIHVYRKKLQAAEEELRKYREEKAEAEKAEAEKAVGTAEAEAGQPVEDATSAAANMKVLEDELAAQRRLAESEALEEFEKVMDEMHAQRDNEIQKSIADFQKELIASQAKLAESKAAAAAAAKKSEIKQKSSPSPAVVAATKETAKLQKKVDDLLKLSDTLKQTIASMKEENRKAASQAKAQAPRAASQAAKPEPVHHTPAKAQIKKVVAHAQASVKNAGPKPPVPAAKPSPSTKKTQQVNQVMSEFLSRMNQQKKRKTAVAAAEERGAARGSFGSVQQDELSWSVPESSSGLFRL